jgi:hypothetical protein
MNKLTKRKPIEEFNHCLNCPPCAQTFPLTSPLAIGFGIVTISKNNEIIWSGDDEHVWLRRFEKRALKEPDNDWVLSINGPLYSAEYQRHGEGEWVLVGRGEGFA